MDVEIAAIWSAAGVLVGFQVAAMTLRINREIAVGDRGDLTWLPIADLLNLTSLATTLLGVFVLPILGLTDLPFTRAAFGLAVILLAGYPFALVGHYDMFTRSPRTLEWLTRQETIAVATTACAAIVYLVLLATTDLGD